MEELITLLFEEREQQRDGKILYEGFNLVPADARAAKMLETLTIKVKKAIRYDAKYANNDIKDEVTQEILLGLIKYTPKFASKADTTVEEIVQALQEENNVLAAKYWTYINICITGDIKDRYKIVNTKIKEKDAVEEIFFSDLIKGDFSEEEIADKLHINSGDYNAKDAGFDFRNWFEDTKEDILTKAQLQFLDHTEEYTKQQKYQYNQKIAKRVNKALIQNFYTTNLKKIEVMNRIKVFDEILTSVNFLNSLKANLDNLLIIDTIYTEEFTTAELKEITALYNNKLSNLSLNLFKKIKQQLEKKRAELITKINRM